MSLYIEKENQTYLWNSVIHHPKFEPYLKNIPQQRFAEWFRSTIQGFYLQWGQRPISQEELKLLNRNTIAYIYQSLSEKPGATPVPTPTVHENHPMMPPAHHSYGSSPPIPDPHSSSQIYQQKPVQVLPQFPGQYEYEKRNESYEQMAAKPAVPSLQGKTDSDKRESQDAMERRLMEEQRQRELDIQMFSPPSQINGKQAVNLNLLKTTAAPMVGMSENEKESIQMIIKERLPGSEPVSLPIQDFSNPKVEGLSQELSPITFYPEPTPKPVDLSKEELLITFLEFRQTLQQQMDRQMEEIRNLTSSITNEMETIKNDLNKIKKTFAPFFQSQDSQTHATHSKPVDITKSQENKKRIKTGVGKMASEKTQSREEKMGEEERVESEPIVNI